MKYSNPTPGWTTELFAVFVSGFLLATLLWLGLWFMETKPGYVTALQAKDEALQNCISAKNECDSLKEKAQGEKETIARQLQEARSGWGRCLQSKRALEGKAQP